MVYFLCKAYDSGRQNCYFALSLPVRGAWVEISGFAHKTIFGRSLPVRGAWVEIGGDDYRRGNRRRSLPVRGAWVEILPETTREKRSTVAPRAGSVG